MSKNAYTDNPVRLGKHQGFVSHPLRGIWSGQRSRCFDPSNKNYHNYGGRGITMHPPWIDDSAAFIRDVIAEIGPRPKRWYTLDRKNNDGNYEPGNIRWATYKQQANNTRKNFRITYHGQTKTLSEWSVITGISGETLGWRFQKGMALDQVFDPTDKRPFRRDAQLFEHDGKIMSLFHWSKHTGIKKQTLVTRLRSGWNFADAVSAPLHQGIRPNSRGDWRKQNEQSDCSRGQD